MKLLKNHGTTIIISLLMGIFLIYLKTPLELIGKAFINTLSLISNNFSNSYYESVGLNNPNTFDSINNLLLILVFAICLFGGLRYLTHEKNELEEELSTMQSNINNIKGKIQPTKQEVEISKDELLARLGTTEKRVIRLTKSLSKFNNIMIMISIMSLFTIILIYYNFVIITGVSTENVNFRNDLTKIAPYTDEKEIKTIQAEWTMIKSKVDYESVTGAVSKIKKKNKIE